MRNHELWIATALTALLLASSAVAEETKLDSSVNHAKKETRKSVRNLKDKTCELVDGKLNCAAKKLKHKAENAADELKTE